LVYDFGMYEMHVDFWILLNIWIVCVSGNFSKIAWQSWRPIRWRMQLKRSFWVFPRNCLAGLPYRQATRAWFNFFSFMDSGAMVMSWNYYARWYCIIVMINYWYFAKVDANVVIEQLHIHKGSMRAFGKWIWIWLMCKQWWFYVCMRLLNNIWIVEAWLNANVGKLHDWFRFRVFGVA